MSLRKLLFEIEQQKSFRKKNRYFKRYVELWRFEYLNIKYGLQIINKQLNIYLSKLKQELSVSFPKRQPIKMLARRDIFFFII